MAFKSKVNIFTGNLQKVFDGTVGGAGIDNTARKNNVINSFQIAVLNALTKQNLVDGIVDEYTDTDSVDLALSTNEKFNLAEKAMTPSGGEEADVLLHFDGTDGDTTTSDATTNEIVTLFGAAHIEEDQSVFGGTSLHLNGSTDYATVSDNTNFTLLDQNFIIDFRFRFTSIPGSQVTLVSKFVDGSNFFTINWFPNRFEVIWRVGGTSLVAQGALSFTPTVDTWYHFAWIRGWNGNPDDFAVTIDGSTIGTVTDSDSLIDIGSLDLTIGAKSDASEFFPGYIDEFRWNKGSTDETATFTPPVSPYNLTRNNMTLLSDPFTAQVQSDTGLIILREEDFDSIILNTDLNAFISRDGGTTFTQGTLVDDGNFDALTRILTASIDLSGQPVGTSMVYKITTLNNKNLTLHATGLLW